MRPAATAIAVLCAIALGGCGNTLQETPIPHNLLEELILNPFPVYWLGDAFHGLAVTEVTGDPSGAYSVQYGNCLEGSQSSCVPPLRVVTSADNSFLPGGARHTPSTPIRGVEAQVEQAGRTIVIPTGAVVVDIYAKDRALARAAAHSVVPINEPAAPDAQLPAALPDTGYAETPLPSQEPAPLHPVS